MRARLIAAAVLLALTGCGRNEPVPSPGGTGPAGDITVLAAASLTEVFGKLGTDFSAAHPGTKINFSFGASSTLARQVTSGATADVFAAASPATMAQVTGAGAAVGQPRVFARNQLVIAVPTGNPAKIDELADLAAPDVKVALCDAPVPCGAAANRALAAAGVAVRPVTLEQDVKSALTKVRLAEVDAALVYRTDTRAAAGEVTGIEFPESAGAVNEYPIVTLADGRNPAGGAAFLAYVVSDAARPVLTAAGFQVP